MGLQTGATTGDGIVRYIIGAGDVKVVDYRPGNGTRYRVMISTVPDEASELLGCKAGSVLVTLLGAGSAMFATATNDCLAQEYVGEKLKLPLPDAIVITKLLGQLLGRPTYTRDGGRLVTYSECYWCGARRYAPLLRAFHSDSDE